MLSIRDLKKVFKYPRARTLNKYCVMYNIYLGYEFVYSPFLSQGLPTEKKECDERTLFT